MSGRAVRYNAKERKGGVQRIDHAVHELAVKRSQAVKATMLS
jgi:hypothetical protein